MKFLLTILGRIFAFLPRKAVEIFCGFIGWLIASFPTPRRRALRQNIYKCFPDFSKKQIRELALDSCKRTVEMALFVLASPYISQKELKKRIIISDFVKEELKKIHDNPHPQLLLVPHFCMMEAITILPILSETALPKTGVFYRPFDNDGMEEWIRKTREKHGIDLLSRRDGLIVSLEYLKDKGCVAILFDQNSNSSGTLTMFFDRLCATSEIAGLLAERTNANIAIFYARRTGFWRAEIEGEFLDAKTQEDVIFKSNDWLEKKLTEDAELRKDWLWLHKRWKAQNNPKTFFRIAHRRVILDEYMKYKGYNALPRKTDFLVRAPHSLNEILEFIPSVRALHASRPDARITIMADPKHAPFLFMLGIVENVVETPNGKSALNKLSDTYYSAQIMFADTPADDKQAGAINADMKFGIRRDCSRKTIKHLYIPSAADLEQPPRALYRNFMENFGLKIDSDFSSVKTARQKNEELLGLCIGDEKEMGLGEWEILIKEFSTFMPDAKFAILYTNRTAKLATVIANIFADKVECSLNASESLKNLAVKLSTCRAASGTDTLLLRLANLLGVPCVDMAGADMIYAAQKITLTRDPKNTDPEEFSSFAKSVAMELTLID